MLVPVLLVLLLALPGSAGPPARAHATSAGSLFVNDFRRDFPELSHRDGAGILADADAIAAAIRAGDRWDALIVKVDRRFHAGERAPEVLSLISCLMQAPIRH